MPPLPHYNGGVVPPKPISDEKIKEMILSHFIRVFNKLIDPSDIRIIRYKRFFHDQIFNITFVYTGPDICITPALTIENGEQFDIMEDIKYLKTLKTNIRNHKLESLLDNN